MCAIPLRTTDDKLESFSFNDELMLREGDRVHLKLRFPIVAFAIVTDELIAAFPEIDAKAKRAKRRFRGFGIAAVAMATVALIIAAAEPFLVSHPAPEGATGSSDLTKGLVSAAAVLGIVSALVGWAGMGIAERKTRWLGWRARAELVRQWNFQYLLTNLGKVVHAAVGGDLERAQYVEARALAFSIVSADLERNAVARLHELLDDQIPVNQKVWNSVGLNARGRPRLPNLHSVADQSALQQVFDAYRAVRFRSQLDYATWMLGAGPFWSHPATQRRVLRRLGRILIAAIVMLHIVLLVGITMELPDGTARVLHFLTVAFALIALGLRVMEEGFEPTARLAQLAAYREEIVGALNIFESGTDLDRIEAARTLEEAAVREMIEFLRSGANATYVM